MAKENTVLAIDVGGDSLKMAEFVFPAGGAIVLKKFAFRKYDDQAEGADVEFAKLYQEMISSANFTAKTVRLSLSGQSSFSRLCKLPPLIGNKGAIDRIIAMEAKQVVPYPMNEVVWDSQLIKHEWIEERTEQQSDGTVVDLSTEHEEYEALIVAVKNDHVCRFTDVIQDSGKEILSVEVAPVALFNAGKATSCRDDECVMLLNIGGRGSNLMIADHNRVFVRSIPIGGNAITQQIANEFGIEYAEAEELKHRHGFVALGGAYEEPESEVAATISKIARNIMTRLHGEVSRSINVWRSQHGGNPPSRVLLSGGGSVMMYITDFFHEKLRLPIEYLNSFGAITFDDNVDKAALQEVAPMFQELIGLSLRNVTHCPVDISLVPKSIKAQKDLNHKKPFFYIGAASLVICVGVFAFGVNSSMSYNKERVERVKSRLDSTQKILKDVQRENGTLNSAKGRFEEASNFLKDRNKWFAMMNEIQSKMPDTMWFITFEGIGDAPVADQPQPSGRRSRGGGGGGMGDPGLFGGMGGGSPEATAKPADNDLKEVKEIRLVGYTLILQHDLLELEFRNKFKESDFFVPEADGGFILEKFEQGTESNNLTSFTIRLKLKEPIKK